MTLLNPVPTPSAMPIPRKKSCGQCRTAKARCSLTAPCERCSERDLRCDYGSARPRAEPYRIPIASSFNSQVRNRSPTNHGGTRLAAVQSPVFDGRTNAATPLFASQGTSAPLDLPDATPQVTETTSACFPGYFSLGGQDGATPFAFPSGDGDLQNNYLMSTDDLFSPTMGRSISTTIQGRAQNSLLLQRKTTTTETFMTAKVVLGQIRQYPRLMIQGTSLPPFLHPRCASSGNSLLPDSCSSEGKHVCMPEILAVCANLVHLFYNRTAASSRFAWGTIYSHQKRLHDEV